MRPKNLKWIYGVLAGLCLAGSVSLWSFVVYHRRVDYATFGLHGIARALAAYVVLSDGDFPNSWKDLEDRGLVRATSSGRSTVEVDLESLGRFSWYDWYSRGVQINPNDFRVGWGGQRLPSGVLIESARFPTRLAPQSLRLTNKLQSLVEQLHGRVPGGTGNDPGSGKGIAPSNLREGEEKGLLDR
jgi:hypothetical protein